MGESVGVRDLADIPSVT